MKKCQDCEENENPDQMDRLEHISKLGDFIPQGDDSFIDDHGITNRWAIRRRAGFDPTYRAEIARQEAQRLATVQNIAGFPLIQPQPATHRMDMVAEEVRNRQEAEYTAVLEESFNEGREI